MRLLCVGTFCIFLWVYSVKRKINISMDDLIIVKHTRVGVGVGVGVCVCVLFVCVCVCASVCASVCLCM